MSDDRWQQYTKRYTAPGSVSGRYISAEKGGTLLQDASAKLNGVLLRRAAATGVLNDADQLTSLASTAKALLGDLDAMCRVSEHWSADAALEDDLVPTLQSMLAIATKARGIVRSQWERAAAKAAGV